MQNEPHDLHHEFPEYSVQIHALKVGNAHFAKIFKEYHLINKEIQRIEHGLEAVSDTYLEGIKKIRLSLKDEVFSMLRAV